MSANYFLYQNKDNINIMFPPNKPLDNLSDTLLSRIDDHELDQSTDEELDNNIIEELALV